MSQNFKVLEDLFNTLISQQDNNSRNDSRTRTRVATIRSVQSGSVTISFGNDTVQVPGVQVRDGLTLIANNIVEVQSLNNGIQSSSFVVTRKIADS